MRRIAARYLAPVGIVAAIATAAFAGNISCSTTGTTACLLVTNSSSGIGISGTSKSGAGLSGSSTSNYGAKATSSSSYGVYGTTTSGAAAVHGVAGVNGAGVLGTSTGSGIGAEGTAFFGDGVLGVSTGSGDGILADSANGVALVGTSSSGDGLVAQADTSGDGLKAETGKGTAIVMEGNDGYGVEALANSSSYDALYADGENSSGADITGITVGIQGSVTVNSSNTYPLYLYNENGSEVFQVGSNGAVVNGTDFYTFARTRTGTGMTKAAVAKTTEPTVEDTGSSTLTNGVATVMLDPTFASTIDTTRAYRVFVDAGGDANPLYVTSKTPGSFQVRESKGGRSSITFDYRIVADALGHAGERMAYVSTAHQVEEPSLQNAPHRLPYPPKKPDRLEINTAPR